MKIVLYKKTILLDRFVGFFSRGEYCHAGILLNDGSFIDARPSDGVSKKLPEQFKLSAAAEVYGIQTTPEQDQVISDFLHAQLGKKYDYWMVAGFIFYKTKEGRKSYGKWFCSELVFAAFHKAGINLLERVDAWKVAPATLSYSSLLISQSLV